MVNNNKRDMFYKSVSVILRVPALFIAEAWYRSDPKNMSASLGGDDKSQTVFINALYYSAILFCLTLVLLPLRKLVNLYMYIVSGILLGIAHYLSFLYVEAEKSNYVLAQAKGNESHKPLLEDSNMVLRLGSHLAAQGIISATVAYLLNLKRWTRLTLLIYATPMLARAVNFPVTDLHLVHNFSAVFAILLVVFFVFNHIPYVLDVLKTGLNKTYVAVQVFGWIPFFLMLWFKVLLPVQFLVFWVTLFALQFFQFLNSTPDNNFSNNLLVLLLASAGECCVTPVSLVGLCVTVSYAAFMILMATKLFLQGREAFAHDNVMHRGWTEGFTMFLLAVQTGITDLQSAQRAFLMSIVLFIVLSSLVQSMYEIADPLLLALAASRSNAIWRHTRALMLTLVLFCLPIYMTLCICRFFDLDFWLLVVVSSCVLTSVQVLGSLVVYGLFLYDGHCQEPWEALDDVIYYAKATTRALEFVVAVFVVVYGVRESLLGEWSWINSGILLIHGYFNVFSRLQTGWKSYLQRREAVKKINSLPEATQAQLDAHNDVCAICYQELRSAARITPCAHYFHGLCLRKWLYVQDKCPLCHQTVTVGSATMRQKDNPVPPAHDDHHQGQQDRDDVNEVHNEEIMT